MCAAALAIAPAAHAAYPGKNGRIVVFGGDSADTMRTMEPDGSDVAVLPVKGTYPSYSPDGQTLAFVKVVSPGSHQIYLMDPDGANQRPVTSLPASSPQLSYPTFSPDGARIAFGNNADVMAVDVDGQNLATLSATGDHDSVPVYTAEGRIVFSRQPTGSEGGDPQIWIMDGDGSNPMKLTSLSGQTYLSDVSPDGLRVTYTNGFGSDLHVYAMDVDGSDVVQLTSTGTARSPAFSPDGRQIVYNDGAAGLATMGVAGSSPVPLGVPGIAPDWQPLPGTPPVIFIPGILGSEIWCDPAARSGRLWPAVPVAEEKLLLAPDGDSNASTECPAAGPAEPLYTDVGHLLAAGDSGIAEAVDLAGLGVKDVYGHALRKMETLVGADRFYAFPWDWRRDTAASLSRLDAVVDAAIAETGAEKVQIVAHSYGGLLSLHYARDPARRAKLARVTSVGSPYLGSPKSIFPLVTGTEMPFDFFGLHTAFGGQDDLRSAAATMRGLYNLWPSAAYGGFLSVTGRTPSPLGAEGTAQVIADSGGVAAIWSAAQSRHASTYDSFDIGDLPWRLIVSGGLPTIGSVKLNPATADEPDRAGITLTPGDSTVPLRSQTLGASSGGAIAGVHTDLLTGELCQASHGGQMGKEELYRLIAPFVLHGDPLDAEWSTQCRGKRAFVLDVLDGDLTLAVPAVPAGRASATAALTGAEAEEQGVVDILRFGRQTLVLADPGKPMQFELMPWSDRTLHLTVRDVDGETSTTIVPETTSRGPIRVAVGADGGVAIVSPGPPAPVADPPPAATPAPSFPMAPAVIDRTPPVVRARARRVRRGYRITLRATDASGIRRIAYRFAPSRSRRTYRRPLRLTVTQARRLRVRAEDGQGNRSREVRVRLPRR